MINELELIDIYRHLHSKTCRYTWRKKNPVKQARLDYFLVSENIVDIIHKCKVKPSYRSDHLTIELDIIHSLLKNSEYLNLINKIIRRRLLNMLYHSMI